jgi:hypothetical protein
MRSFVAACAFASFAGGLAGCSSTQSSEPWLASARAASDFDSYHLARIGLLPFHGAQIDAAQSQALQQAFSFELSRAAPFEVVVLSPADLAEARASDPYTHGEYETRGVLEIAQRFRLDGLMMGTVTDMQVYTPQALAMQVELVSCETGLAIWSARVHLDTTDAGTREQLERFAGTEPDNDEHSAAAQLSWLSPARLARFAAREVARTL